MSRETTIMTSSSLEIAFARFHLRNPEVYRYYEKFTKDVIRRGFHNYSSHAIMMRIRWHVEIDTKGDAFKINNNFSAYYARLYMRRNPEDTGFFRTRAVVGDWLRSKAA